MSTKKPARKQGRLWLSLLALISSGCITVQERTFCSVAGKLSAGGICTHLISAETHDLTFEEYLDFLEAQSERPDPVDPMKTLPAHGAAICMSSEDFEGFKTEFENMCRELGSKCKFENVLKNLRNPSKIRVPGGLSQ